MRRMLIASSVCLAIVCPTSFAQLFEENFEYPAGDSLADHGWEVQSGGQTNSIVVVSPGLSYPGYVSSNIGNAARISGTGQDVRRPVGPITSGSIYGSLVVSVDSAKLVGDYFFHLKQTPDTSTVLVGKVFVKMASNGRVAFGVSKRANAPNALFSDSVYSLDSTYLLVLKYRILPDTNDDQASLFIFSGAALPGSEPGTPTVGPAADVVPDPTEIGYVDLRQGNSILNTPSLRIDGIRIGTNWGEAPLPVQIVGLAATCLSSSMVRLAWTTLSEINNYGFQIQRSANPTDFQIIPGSFIPGHGTTNEPQHYAWIDSTAPPGVLYYRLKQIDLDGTVHYSEGICVNLLTRVMNKETQIVFPVSQSYPNPFNSTTRIVYGIGSQESISLKIFDLLGHEVATLVNETLDAGTHSAVWNAHHVASGVYLYRLRAGEYQETKRLVLLR